MTEVEEGSVHTRVSLVRHIVEIVAILAAGVWAFYTFIYEERIKPAHEPLEAVETVTLTREGRIRDMDIIRANVTIKNVGKTEFDTVAQKLEIFGYRYGRETHSKEIKHDVYEVSNTAPRTQRRLVFTHVDLYDPAVSGRAGVHNIVSPDSTTGGSYVLAIPHGEYDLLYATFQYFPHKTPIGQRFLMNVQRNFDGSFTVSHRGNDLLEDNVNTELALTQ